MVQADGGLNARSTRADARRSHLLDTARKLIIENGFHRTGMAQIAASSGIKGGQIYRDFQGKEDIIAAICEADVPAWLREDILNEAVAKKDLPAIRAWIGRFGSPQGPLDGARLMAEIVAEAWRNERIAEINRCIDIRIRTSLGSALAALAPEAERSKEIELLVDFILAIGFGIQMRRMINPGLDLAGLSRSVSALIDRRLDDFAS